VSVDSSVPVLVGDGTSISVGSDVLVNVGGGLGLSVGSGVSVAVIGAVGVRRVAVTVAVDVSAVREVADWVGAAPASAVNCATGFMLRASATPRHSRTTKANPPPTAHAIPNLRRLRLSIVSPLPLL
jgi:hypothetical protein